MGVHWASLSMIKLLLSAMLLATTIIYIDINMYLTSIPDTSSLEQRNVQYDHVQENVHLLGGLELKLPSESNQIPRAQFQTSKTRKADVSEIRKAKVLMGIFTCDGYGNPRYRQVFRDLFDMHPKVCSLSRFKKMTKTESSGCGFIYTFVIGGNQNQSGPTELVDRSLPVIVPSADRPRGLSSDLYHEDITWLNIRENMNEGKSQTWFYYASQVLEEFDIDYAGKMDTDSLPYLDKYFSFAESSLPPAPYNKRVIAGSIYNKGWWNRSIDFQTTSMDQRKKEKYFLQRYGVHNLHLYAEGQMYILSRDLAKGVGDVAREVPKTYIEGHEDHDVSAMAFLSLKGEMDHPMKLLIIAGDQKWWRHPVKLKMGPKKWRKFWDKEMGRMKGILAEQQKGNNITRT